MKTKQKVNNLPRDKTELVQKGCLSQRQQEISYGKLLRETSSTKNANLPFQVLPIPPLPRLPPPRLSPSTATTNESKKIPLHL